MFHLLPDEILDIIFGHLNINDAKRLRLTSKMLSRKIDEYYQKKYSVFDQILFNNHMLKVINELVNNITNVRNGNRFYCKRCESYSCTCARRNILNCNKCNMAYYCMCDTIKPCKTCGLIRCICMLCKNDSKN